MNRVICRIDRKLTHTHSGWPVENPSLIVTLCGCVHEVLAPLDAKPGDEIECSRCGDLAPQIAAIRDFMASDRFSHVTLRSSAANRCRSWQSYYFYRVEKDSPTQCELELTAPACNEIEAVIRECGKHAIPGPSRGELAIN